MLKGTYRLGDQHVGVVLGEIQKVDDEERELAEDDEESPEGRDNLDTEACRGVASSLGDLS